ncbi:T9SS type A sorting domain-containing protein [Aureispira sp. CCB-QB1]|uniref:T9SS type A sorting domain-containing protein n=1 Tax=Aureispira sp. CCB-QB1 TaxID=1313421 RepID=UPI000695AB25|nr:T9SS type A sorting domain-containing protein [Aureispira sp. CCB-QB1]
MFKSTSKFLQLICCLGTLLFFSSEASASHSMGLDLTYRCVGNNQYEINLTFYRDCNGIGVPQTTNVNWAAVCGSGSVRLSQVSMQEITPSCPGIVGTACNGGNGVYGIEEYKFQGILTLPAGCSNVTLSYSNCCRNNAITTLNSPSGERIYVETEIVDPALCNNSPIFTNDPVPFGCVGQPVFYNHGASDADGDDLVYSLVDCMDDSSTTVGYAAGYSATAPLSTTNGVTIDPATGAISFTPDVAQVGVFCVSVKEYRNGVFIGEIIRDIQFTAVPCSNNVPTLSGINNTTDFSTTATVGTQLCFDVFSTDPDRGQTTSLSWNNGIAGAIFTTGGTPHATGTFCWTPSSSDVGIHTFTVTVSDDYCPIVGQNIYTFTISVQDNSVPCDSIDVNIVSTNDVTCSSNDGGAVLVASNGVAPYNYQLVNWTTGEFFSNTTGIFNTLTPGSYSVWVEDANGCTPACSGHTFVIGGNVVPLSATAAGQDVPCPSNSTNVMDSTNSGGSVTVTATGGTAPYLYSIDGVNFQSSGVFANLGVGTYNTIVMDANGCSATATATVGEPDPINIGVVSVTPATCGLANGSITISATGGDGNYLYYINGQSQSSPTFTNLAAGTYTFSVCDMNYCLYDTTIVIPGVPGFTATTTTTSPSCEGDCNGTATVAISGDSSNTYTVVWNNGQIGLSIANLCAGVYTATITDANGCEVTVTATVSDPDPVSVNLVASSDETCAGNDGTAVLNITGGTLPYVIDLANFTTATTLSNATGVFTNLNAGQHVVNVTDANGCSVNCAENFVLEGCGSGVDGRAPVSLGTATGLGPILSVNPNPASSLVQVRYQTSATAVNIAILDANGKSVYSQEQSKGSGSLEIMINNWSNSTYFVVMTDNSGKLIKTEKLVISK